MPAQTQRLFEWDAADKTYFRITAAKEGLIAGRADIPALQGDVDDYLRAQLYDGVMDGQAVRIASLQLASSEFGETVTVEVAETTLKRQALARAILITTLIPQLILILVAAGAVQRAIRVGLAPLHTIALRLGASSHRQLATIPDEGVPVEVRPLTHSLNDLLLRLESALTAQRRFVAEAAHQLRTPLTAIKLQAEDIRREVRPEEIRPLADALLRSTERAVRLSNQLLSLARAEPDSASTRDFQRFDLLKLVSDTGAEWVPLALGKGIEMQFVAESHAGPVWFEGDAGLIREALGNLLDNTVKYAAPGHVCVRLLSEPSMQIVVEDDGPGIPSELQETMLRRFARGNRGEGTGLGLAIAREIARVHGGDLQLASGAGGKGLTARMTLKRM
jgi:two-component system sensor histidine kinase TctE